MNRNRIRDEAARRGFRLGRVKIDGHLMWTWQQGPSRTWPQFPTEDAALSWMDHSIRTATICSERWRL